VGETEWTAEVARDGDGRFRVQTRTGEMTVAAERLAGGVIRLHTAEGETLAIVTAAAGRRFVHVAGDDWVLERVEATARGSGGEHALTSPMPGLVVRVHVEAGDRVEPGEPLVTVEAMKMEHVLRAPHGGTVARVDCTQGEMVEAGVPLVELEAG
jgi:biotin carboxyl carrier protein